MSKSRKQTSAHDREPENMTAAVVAKCHASNMLHLIDEQAKGLRDKKRLWKKRLAMCHRAIAKYARERA